MTDRWKRMEAMLESRRGMRRALDTGPTPVVPGPTPLNVPVVHKPESVVWTQSGDGERRAWHVAGDGSLHETPESLTWTAERAAERAVRGKW